METKIQLKENTIALLTPMITTLESLNKEVEALQVKKQEASVMITTVIAAVISQEGINDLSNYNITIQDNSIILTPRISEHDSESID